MQSVGNFFNFNSFHEDERQQLLALQNWTNDIECDIGWRSVRRTRQGVFLILRNILVGFIEYRGLFNFDCTGTSMYVFNIPKVPLAKSAKHNTIPGRLDGCCCVLGEFMCDSCFVEEQREEIDRLFQYFSIN